MHETGNAVVLSLLFPTVIFWLEVKKTEPPTWWIGHTIKPVRVMILGKRLDGARIDFPDSGLAVTCVRENSAGTYAFTGVSFGPVSKPGQRVLKIVTRSGEAAGVWPVGDFL